MWSLMGKMGPPEPKMPLLKGGYHTLIASCLNPIPNKEFSYIKSNNLSVRNCQNYPSTMEKVNSSPTTQVQPERITQIPTSNKKKRKKRRRRRKKCKNQQQTPTTSRQRTISIESEDNFILFVEDCHQVSEEETETDFGSSDSIIPHKKVRFASDLCQIHPMVAWSFAYQAARKGPWEEYARDRCRFRRRVADTEAVIGHVFTEDHRSRIYDQRFSEDL